MTRNSGEMLAQKIQYARRAFWHFRFSGWAGLRRFRAENGAGVDRSQGHLDGAAANRQQFSRGFDLPITEPRRAMRVGTILDPFSELAFGYEWQQIPLRPSDWHDHYESLDLLFVESAWHGNSDAWQYQLTGSSAPSEALRELVSACKELGIPTVFWNKEDPYHFDDFIDTAKIFDWVFTTERDLIERYKKVLKHDRVRALLFGAQPVIHNPGSRSTKPGDVCFAGTYFNHKFPERAEQINMLLEGTLKSITPGSGSLDIYSRFQDVGSEYRFPEEYQPYVKGELTYEQMLRAYRSYNCFLNVNSIPNSTTMFSRRVFEVLACGTPVISASSPALEGIFGTGVVQVADSDEAANWIKALRMSPDLRDEFAYEARMKILLGHTYSHRVDEILKRVGLNNHVVGKPRVSIMAATNRPKQVPHLLKQVGKQVGVEVQLLVATHGFEATPEHKNLANDLALNAQWFYQDEIISLGSIYNFLIARADYPIVAKFDDDDDYGPFYLLEQADAIDSMAADVCGKKSHFVTLYLNGVRRSVMTYPGQEHFFTGFVSGPTIVARRETMLEIGFEDVGSGEDTAFLKAVSDSGGKIWATGRYGFTQNRLGNSHTWKANSVEILRHSRLIGSPDVSTAISGFN